MTSNQNELAYFAGIVDGEGHISILKSKPKQSRWTPTYRLRIGVGNVSEALIRWIAERFGGCYHKRTFKRWQPIYEWEAATGDAADILRAIRPHMIVKTRQADVALSFLALRNTRSHATKGRRGFERVPQVELAFREECRTQLNLLNKRGRAA